MIARSSGANSSSHQSISLWDGFWGRSWWSGGWGESMDVLPPSDPELVVVDKKFRVKDFDTKHFSTQSPWNLFRSYLGLPRWGDLFRSYSGQPRWEYPCAFFFLFSSALVKIAYEEVRQTLTTRHSKRMALVYYWKRHWTQRSLDASQMQFSSLSLPQAFTSWS